MAYLHECAVHMRCCALIAPPHKFEPFIREAFPFQRHLAGYKFINIFFEPMGPERESCVCLLYCENSKACSIYSVSAGKFEEKRGEETKNTRFLLLTFICGRSHCPRDCKTSSSYFLVGTKHGDI
jgi:hypothetical protein